MQYKRDISKKKFIIAIGLGYLAFKKHTAVQVCCNNGQRKMVMQYKHTAKYISTRYPSFIFEGFSRFKATPLDNEKKGFFT